MPTGQAIPKSVKLRILQTKILGASHNCNKLKASEPVYSFAGRGILDDTVLSSQIVTMANGITALE